MYIEGGTDKSAESASLRQCQQDTLWHRRERGAQASEHEVHR
jgi:hypothetical protein